jgi:uncharacterized membrane protein
VLILIAAFASQLPAQSPEFSVALSPATITLPQGGVTSFTVTIDASDHPKIDLSLNGLPEGVRASIPPGRTGNTTIVLTAGSTATTGSFAIQVLASTPAKSQVQILILNVKPMPIVPQWEYRVVTTGSEEQLNYEANNLGAYSWELVSVIADREQDRWTGFFKRMKN